MRNPTLVFIPGLICNADLFAHQFQAIGSKANYQVADTRTADDIGAMAAAALAGVTGPIVPIGLSMGGYIALEMARQAPERMAGMALLNTNYQADDEAKKKQRRATIALAKSAKFKGVTRHLLKSFLSPAAMEDDALVARVIAMADDIGATGFVRQQTAILGRRDQGDTLAAFAPPLLVLCGMLDTLTPPELSKTMAEIAPNAELMLLEDVGHLSSMEAPEAVNAALEAFIAKL